MALLRRGAHLRRGENRIVIGSGRGSKRRYAVTGVVLGARRKGALKVRRRVTRPGAALIAVRGPAGGFERVRVLVNGKRLRGRAWVVGKRTRASRWPFARRSFEAILGAGDGLRRGRNRVQVTAWSRDGGFDRAGLTLQMPRSAPLPEAGPSRGVAVGAGARLDGRRTRAAPGNALRYRWRIVSAPKGSRPLLRGAASARPRLVPDLPGRYRVRLVAAGKPRRSGSKARASAQAPPATSDETTVEAVPSSEPIGVPIRTMSAGGIEVGGTLYPPGGPGVQLLVLDRSLLSFKSERTFGSGSSVTQEDVEELLAAVRELSPDHLVVLSGGGRQVSAPVTDPQFAGTFGSVIEAAGGNAEPLAEWPGAWAEAFRQGRWSIVGSPVAGTAYQNLFGSIFGASAGAGSPAGALTGYLQKDSSASELFGFSTGQYASFDTQVPGSPEGVNRIRIDDTVYTSEGIPAGYGGFHVLVLDSLLERTAERTFVTNDPLSSIQSGVVAMQEFISAISAPGLGAPGYLVIVQSIGQPQGSIIDWVDDEALVANQFGHHANAAIPRNDSVWYSTAAGESLAGALGGLGGPLAHDHVAQLTSIAMSQPKPRATPGGYTLLASTGAVGSPGPIDPASLPVSRLQAMTPESPARVTGTLSRDRQTFWTVESAGWLEGLGDETLGELIYRPAVAWPLSSTPQRRAANAFIAEQLKLKWSDVREAYWRDTAKAPTTLKEEVEEVAYEPGSNFGEGTFLAVRAQLGRELRMVSNVDTLVAGWEKLFAKGEKSGLVDLSEIAQPIYEAVKKLNDERPLGAASATVANQIAETVWLASSVLTLGALDEYAAPLGLFASALDWTSSLQTSSADTAPEAGVVEVEASRLAGALSKRMGGAQERVSLIGDIFLTDWGKLKTASEWTANKWALEPGVSAKLVRSLSLAARREFTAALLALVYDVYIVDPSYISGDFSSPAEINCAFEEDVGHVEPFADAATNPSSWISRAVGFEDPDPEVDPNVIQRAAGLTQRVDVQEGFTKSLAHSAPETITKPLFEPIEAGSETRLGEDPLAFFADPRFDQLWFYCHPVD